MKHEDLNLLVERVEQLIREFFNEIAVGYDDLASAVEIAVKRVEQLEKQLATQRKETSSAAVCSRNELVALLREEAKAYGCPGVINNFIVSVERRLNQQMNKGRKK